MENRKIHLLNKSGIKRFCRARNTCITKLMLKELNKEMENQLELLIQKTKENNGKHILCKYYRETKNKRGKNGI